MIIPKKENPQCLGPGVHLDCIFWIKVDYVKADKDLDDADNLAGCIRLMARA